MNDSMSIPPWDQYLAALDAIPMTPNQKAMLLHHYNAHNRTVTYTQLAEAVGFKDYSAANLQYGLLANALGEELGFPFVHLKGEDGEKFMSSAIGLGVHGEYKSSEHFELMMHHELAKAIDKWDEDEH